MQTIQPISFAKLLEQIEIIRSGLRWANQMKRAEIQRTLHQVNNLRESILHAAGVEKIRAQQNAQAAAVQKPAQARRLALLERSFAFEGVFGENPKLLETLETVEKAAKTDLPVLIEGESGTGKELLAKVIHANSRRSENPFVSVNCGAISPTLLESELFGHVKGAFTGSIKDRKGKFETAGGGTIFLDELGELPPESQVKLLRVLQSGEIQRVGTDEPVHVDTRIVAATNRTLFSMSMDGKFREDLYYRISVISVTIPPLRERKDEIPLLLDYFGSEAVEQLNRSPIKLSPRLYHFLMNYRYRGNVRELRNIVYRIASLSDEIADLVHLPEHIRPDFPESPADGALQSATPSLEAYRNAAVEAAEKQFIEEHLSKVNGNITTLAKRLQMNRSYLQTLIKKRGIQASDYRRNKKPA